MLCLVGVIVGGPANLVVNDLREKRSWVEKRFTLTLFTGFYGIYGALTRYSFVIRSGRPPSPVTRFINWGRLLFGWFKFYYAGFVAWGRCQTTQQRRICCGDGVSVVGACTRVTSQTDWNWSVCRLVLIFFIFFVLLMSRLSCAFTFPQHCVCACVCVLDGALGLAWVEQCVFIWRMLHGRGEGSAGLYSFQDNEWKSFDSKYINNAKCASLESARRADILQLICIHMRKRIHNIHDINHRLMRYSCYSHVTYS